MSLDNTEPGNTPDEFDRALGATYVNVREMYEAREKLAHDLLDRKEELKVALEHARSATGPIVNGDHIRSLRGEIALRNVDLTELFAQGVGN